MCEQLAQSRHMKWNSWMSNSHSNTCKIHVTISLCYHLLSSRKLSGHGFELAKCVTLKMQLSPFAKWPHLYCTCTWTPTTAFVGHQYVPSAANQHTFWQSLIRCCWTFSMEQSANPAARVRHDTRTISTSTQNASVWSLTAAAPSDSVFRVLCTNWLTSLLTYC